MAVTGILDPKLVTIPAEAYANAAFAPGQVRRADIDVRSTAPAVPTFDAAHQIFTSNRLDGASQATRVKNLNGPLDPLHADVTLSYEFTRGYSTTNETSKGFSTSLAQEFNYEIGFPGAVKGGGSTTLTVEGSFNWTESTTTDTSTAVTQSVQVPVDVPVGRVYEARIVMSQQTMTIPYELPVRITGDVSFEFAGGGGTTVGPGGIYKYAAEQGLALRPFRDVKWSDFGWTGPDDAVGLYTLNGTLVAKDGGTAEVEVYDVTDRYAPAAARPDAGGAAAARDAAPAAAVAPADGPPIGVHRTFGAGGDAFHATAFDDLVQGRAGDDRIALGGGDDIAHGGAGDDRILAGEGRSLLDGGGGDDRLAVASTVSYSNLLGGAGDDVLMSRAPGSMMYGGAGDDLFRVHEATAGGTVVVDGQGHNRLRVETDQPIGFERVEGSDDLYILLGGRETYDRRRDVVWVDFFAGGDNRVNGVDADEVARLAVVFEPAAAPADHGPLG